MRSCKTGRLPPSANCAGSRLQEDRDWQRLDKWLWSARFLKTRADCARLVALGHVRLNRQATDKPHARLRPGDIITLPLRDTVRVMRVLTLATRRGPAPEAQALYELLDDPGPIMNLVANPVAPGVKAGHTAPPDDRIE